MADNNRKRFANYTIDFESSMLFPDSRTSFRSSSTPWLVVGELVEEQSNPFAKLLAQNPGMQLPPAMPGMRPVWVMKDKSPSGAKLTIAWYTKNPQDDAKAAGVGVGKTIALRNVDLYQFMDGQQGFRLEDASAVTIIDCNLAALRAANKLLIARQKGPGHLSCANATCATPIAELTCAKCKIRYCGAKCQKADWAAHKKLCEPIGALLRWNVL